jgi:hypothetical protein
MFARFGLSCAGRLTSAASDEMEGGQIVSVFVWRICQVSQVGTNLDLRSAAKLWSLEMSSRLLRGVWKVEKQWSASSPTTVIKYSAGILLRDLQCIKSTIE